MNSIKEVEISIVTTLYKSEKFVLEFMNQVRDTMQQMNCNNYELIMVLDGITDKAEQLVLSQKNQFENLKLIELSRNFGHHNALMAGMTITRGKYIMLIDCDLEIKPNITIDFMNKLKEHNADVVYGYQTFRKGRFIEKYFGGIFWKIFNYFSETKIPENVITERIMTKQYVKDLTSLNDKNLFLGGLMYWVGYKQIGIPIQKETREGQSSYTLNKRIKLMINAITSFSAYPLKILFNLGLIITILSFIFGMYYIVKKIIYPELIQDGFTSLITAIIFSTGIIVLSIGALGLYLEKIFNQVKNRPTYIIKKITE